MTEDDKICADFRMVGGKIISFSIHYISKIDKKWRDVIRVDTAKHGDKNKEGLAHVHHFYKKKSEWYQLLSQKHDDFNILYEQWLVNIIKRAKHYKRNYLYNK